jgi:hypothetical protein
MRCRVTVGNRPLNGQRQKKAAWVAASMVYFLSTKITKGTKKKGFL